MTLIQFSNRSIKELELIARLRDNCLPIVDQDNNLMGWTLPNEQPHEVARKIPASSVVRQRFFCAPYWNRQFDGMLVTV